MICPGCGRDAAFPVTLLPPLSVCPLCGRTVVLGEDSIRLAVSSDTIHLNDDEKIALRKLRPTT